MLLCGFKRGRSLPGRVPQISRRERCFQRETSMQMENRCQISEVINETVSSFPLPPPESHSQVIHWRMQRQFPM